MNVWKMFGLVTCFIMTASLNAQDQAKSANATVSQLVGTYVVTGEEKYGRKIPDDELEHVTVRIAENTITTIDKDKKEVFAATYEIDQSRKPWRIKMTATVVPVPSKERTAAGLIELDGDMVTLIYSLSDIPPAGFKTAEKQLMFTMKRMQTQGTSEGNADKKLK